MLKKTEVMPISCFGVQINSDCVEKTALNCIEDIQKIQTKNEGLEKVGKSFNLGNVLIYLKQLKNFGPHNGASGGLGS